MKAFILVIALSGCCLAAAAFAQAKSSATAVGAPRTGPMEDLSRASFAVLKPSYLPAGTTLVAQLVSQNGDGTSNVDLFYQLPSGGRLHIWQTSRSHASLTSKDPTATGTSVAGLATTWKKNPAYSGNAVSLSGEVGGLIISLDATIAFPNVERELALVADSLR